MYNDACDDVLYLGYVYVAAQHYKPLQGINSNFNNNIIIFWGGQPVKTILYVCFDIHNMK